MRPSAFNQPIPLPFLVAGMAIYPKLFNLPRQGRVGQLLFSILHDQDQDSNFKPALLLLDLLNQPLHIG